MVAFVAPASAAAAFLLIVAVGYKLRADLAFHDDDAQLLLLLALVAIPWGAAMAAIFGGLVLSAMLVVSEPRRPPRWLYPAGGLAAVGLSCGMAFLVGRGFGLGGLLFAPWLVFWGTEPTLVGPAAVLCVFGAGALGGRLYERMTRPSSPL